MKWIVFWSIVLAGQWGLVVGAGERPGFAAIRQGAGTPGEIGAGARGARECRSPAGDCLSRGAEHLL